MQSTTLMECSKQWSSRPDDERFCSLTELRDHVLNTREHSNAVVASTRQIKAAPGDDLKSLVIENLSGDAYSPTHAAFGQLATLAGAPAGYLRTLPSPMAADCINWGLQYGRDIEDIGVLLYKNGAPILRAATGPAYGRIWDSDIVGGLVQAFGDGLSGRFRIPGEFGERVAVTRANTTLYAGDRDMFVFLADEDHRIDIPDRRDGKSGSLARGFFCWNSEVGSATFGIKSFLFDPPCANRIVWGARDAKQITVRHTAKAPDRFIEEARPALLSFANGSPHNVVTAIAEAKKARLDNVGDWLASRFGKQLGARISAAHKADEGRPIERLWDVVTGATAYARNLGPQDARVALETQAGKLLDAF